jgi:hypothetical protein
VWAYLDFLFGVGAAIGVLELVTSQRWHNLFHRHYVHYFLRGRLVCRRCSDEYTEAAWRTNLLRKLGDL